MNTTTIDQYETRPADFVAAWHDHDGHDPVILAHAPGCADLDGAFAVLGPVTGDEAETPWPCATCIVVPNTHRTVALENDRNGFGDGTGGTRTKAVDNAPTEKQIRFLQALLRGAMIQDGSYDQQNDPETSIEHAGGEGATRRSVSKAIDTLLANGTQPVWDAPVAGQVGCSPKQESFIQRLAAERGVSVDPSWLVSKTSASNAIDTLLAQPKAKERAPKASDGYTPSKGDVHVIDGEYFRVHESQGTGRLYAALWNGSGFSYERGAITRITADNKIDAQEAARFGAMYQRCCFCSMALDTPESTAAGYGPKCATRHGLPWG